MDKCEAIKELELYQKEKGRLRYLEGKLAELRGRMAYPPHNDVYVDGGNKGGTTEFMLDKLAEIEQTYLSQLTYCYGIVNDVGTKIDMLDFPHDYILRQFYLENNSITEIGYQIKYSCSSIKRHKEKALDEYCSLPQIYSLDYWKNRIKCKDEPV